MRHMVLGHDGGEVGRAGRTQPFRADARMIGVDPVAAAERRPRPQQRLQRLWRDGPQKNGEAPLDYREVCLALPQVMQQRRLLQQLARLTLETDDGLEHVEAMALIIDGQLQEEGRERAEDALSTRPLLRRNASRRVPPELANPAHRGAGHSSPSVSGRPQRSFRRSSSKKLRPPVNWTSSTCKPGAATCTSAPGWSAYVCWPSQVRIAEADGSRRVICDCSGRTIGRLNRLCGFSGMKMMARTSGWTIGPPSDSA